MRKKLMENFSPFSAGKRGAVPSFSSTSDDNPHAFKLGGGGVIEEEKGFARILDMFFREENDHFWDIFAAKCKMKLF